MSNNLTNNTGHQYSRLILAIRDLLVSTETEDISKNDYANTKQKVNTVTTGDIFDIDLDKMTLFPLAHIVVNNTTINPHHYVFNVSVLLMDIVDINKQNFVNEEPGGVLDNYRNTETSSILWGNNNEADILNELMFTGTYLTESLRRGTLSRNQIKLVEDSQVLCEPFYEKSENMLAGWSLTFDVEMRNNIVNDLC